MISTLTKVAMALAFSVTLVLCAPARINTTCAAELPMGVRDALEKNAAAATTLEVHWTMQRTSPLPLGDLLKLLEQPKALKLLTPKECRFATTDNKMYFWDQYRGGKKWEVRELAFDTECFYEGSKTGMHITDVSRFAGQSHNQVFVPDFLNAAGIFEPNTYQTFGHAPTSLVLHMLEDGGKLDSVTKETMQGASCLRIDLTYRDYLQKFFLDPVLNYAVRRQEQWSGSERISATVCDEFRPLKPPLQLPQKCRTDYYVYMKHSLSDKSLPLITETSTVTKLSQSPLPHSRFVVTPDVGMNVADSRLPEAREFASGYAGYVVPARPEDMQKAIDKGRTEQRDALASQKRAGWQLYSFTSAVAVGIFVIIVGAAYLGLRWRAARD